MHYGLRAERYTAFHCFISPQAVVSIVPGDRKLEQHIIEFWTSPGFVSDEAYNKLRDTPGAEYRFAAALIPGSPVSLELIEYRSISQYSIAPVIQDIGVGHILFMIGDINEVASRETR